MEVSTFAPRDYFGSNMYLVASGGECAIIDPSVKVSEILGYLERGNYTLRYIILTHAHFDHICEIDSFVREFPLATVIVGDGDKNMLSDSYLNCYRTFLGADKGYHGEYTSVFDGDVLDLGEERISVIKTPGHTPGSISLLLKDCIFVGDTVFSGGGVGRCDLPGGNFYLLRESLEKLLSLCGELTVYSGHGEAAKLNDIKINFI